MPHQKTSGEQNRWTDGDDDDGLGDDADGDDCDDDDGYDDGDDDDDDDDLWLNVPQIGYSATSRPQVTKTGSFNFILIIIFS